MISLLEVIRDYKLAVEELEGELTEKITIDAVKSSVITSLDMLDDINDSDNTISNISNQLMLAAMLLSPNVEETIFTISKTLIHNTKMMKYKDSDDV